MIVLGSQPDSWASSMRAALLELSRRASSQINDVEPEPGSPDYYRLRLLDGAFLMIEITPKKVDISLHETPDNWLIRISDESIGLDHEDLQHVAIDAVWVDKIIDRWIELAADYLHVDAASAKTAQLAALNEDTRTHLLAIYRHVQSHMTRSGHTQQMDIHLTLPTDYWTANIACVDETGRRYAIAEDPAFFAQLEKLPEACEIIDRQVEGEGTHFEIVPLYLTPVRIG